MSRGEMDVEIVERKGLGHPDSICDAVMERISQALSRAYLEKFGVILHHNCDKGLLVAGKVERRFGGGRVIEPMRLVIGDRASFGVGGEKIDVAGIAEEAAKVWFRENLRIDPDRHLNYQVELKPGSEELTGLFERQRVLGANDTSAVVGYAPLSETERLVLETERYLNSKQFKKIFPETGEDVKVMGVRTVNRLEFTVAMPLLDSHINSEADYFSHKDAVLHDLENFLQSRIEAAFSISVGLNTLDRPGLGMAGMYLSVLGTSAEDADSGEVGRGNQVNGIIALNRPRGSEAAAGKNPVSHVGKIYNVLAHQLAARLQMKITELKSVTVWLCSRIGEPIDHPRLVSVQVQLYPGVALDDVSRRIREIIIDEFEKMPVFCNELAKGYFPVC